MKSIKPNESPQTKSEMVPDKSMPEVEENTEHIMKAVMTLSASSTTEVAEGISTKTNSAGKKAELSGNEPSGNADATSFVEKIEESVSEKETLITTAPHQTTLFGHGKFLF